MNLPGKKMRLLRVCWCDDEEIPQPLGIGTVTLYERLPQEGKRHKKPNPIGFVHFPVRKTSKEQA